MHLSVSINNESMNILIFICTSNVAKTPHANQNTGGLKKNRIHQLARNPLGKNAHYWFKVSSEHLRLARTKSIRE